MYLEKFVVVVVCGFCLTRFWDLVFFKFLNVRVRK